MLQRKQHLFIVRIWHEPGGSDGPIWRGSVDHISSADRCYFIDLSHLLEFIQEKLAEDLCKMNDERESPSQ